MNRVRLLMLSVAFLAALLAAYLFKGILGKPAPQAPQPVVVAPVDDIEVLVAAKDLGTGELLGADTLIWRSWPRTTLGPSMITKDAQPDALDKFKTYRARLPMVQGEPVVGAKIVNPEDRGFMSAILPEGMRGISISISDRTSVGGFVLPNDRVDVILTRRLASSQGGGGSAASETVLTNVKVLAINQIYRQDGAGAAVPDGKTAVLELDPEQAEIIARIANVGELSLTLRSLAEGGNRGSDGGKPELAEIFRSGGKTTSGGPLVVRYGRESTVTNK